MQYFQSSVFAREDTFFGVCTAIGEDFGFNRLWLRLGFAALLFFNPTAAIGGYLGLGLVVLASRLLVPNPRVAAAPEPVYATAAESDGPVPLEAQDQMELALAA